MRKYEFRGHEFSKVERLMIQMNLSLESAKTYIASEIFAVYNPALTV
jgi:hypothetical protein